MGTIIIAYLMAINVLAFLIFGLDKWKATHGKWRISERFLLCIAMVGGAFGAWLGMGVFHHKTKKPKFYMGVPLMLLVWLGVVLAIIHMSPPLQNKL